MIAQASPSGDSLDKSGLAYNLGNGLSASLAGGLESGSAWAGGYTFIGLQDRGLNAKRRNEVLDDTTSFIGRFQSLRPQPNANAAGASPPYSLTPTWSRPPCSRALPRPAAAWAAPALNSVGANHFTGRFDNFATDLSTNRG